MTALVPVFTALGASASTAAALSAGTMAVGTGIAAKKVLKSSKPIAPPQPPAIPPAPPQTPAQVAEATPPPAGSTTEFQKKKDDLSQAGGFRSNLFTGGLGLKTLSQANIAKRKLGLG